MVIEHPEENVVQFQELKPGELFYDCSASRLYLKTVDATISGSDINSVSINFVPGQFAFFHNDSSVVPVKRIKLYRHEGDE